MENQNYLTTDELTEAMQRLGTALEKARPNKNKIKRYYKKDSMETIKLYGNRDSNRYKHMFYTDEAGENRKDWLLNTIEMVFGLKISRSVLMRRCLEAYEAELIELLMNTKGKSFLSFDNYLDSLETERRSLYRCANVKKRTAIKP